MCNIIQIIFLSLIFIIISHKLLQYLTNILTIPKEKQDFEFIEKCDLNRITIGDESSISIKEDCTEINSLPLHMEDKLNTSSPDIMKEELKRFLNEQLKTEDFTTTNNYLEQ